MAADKQNVSIYRGDSAVLKVTITDETGAALNLTGYSLSWTMAASAGGNSLATKTAPSSGITVDDVTGGAVSVHLTSSDTGLLGRFWHQLVVTSPSGDVSTVTTGTLSLVART